MYGSGLAFKTHPPAVPDLIHQLGQRQAVARGIDAAGALAGADTAGGFPDLVLKPVESKGQRIISGDSPSRSTTIRAACWKSGIKMLPFWHVIQALRASSWPMVWVDRAMQPLG